MLWGATHNAPFPDHDIKGVEVVHGNPLQFMGADRIVVADGRRYRVQAYHDNHDGGSYVKTITPRYVVFAKPPILRSDNYGKGLFFRLRYELQTIADQLDDPVRGWVSRLLLGSKTSMPKDISEAFKFLGLLHILVISGLHITIIAGCCMNLMRWLVRMSYALRLITSVECQRFQTIGGYAVLMFIIIYGCSIGFGAPAQRAVLLFIVQFIGAKFFSQVGFWQKITIVFFLQSLVFPVGFFSDSMLLSWGAYLTIAHCHRQALLCTGWLAKARCLLLQGQLIISALIVCFFQELCLIAIPLNLLLMPIIPAIVLSAGLLLLPLPALCIAWLTDLHAMFLQGLVYLAQTVVDKPWLWIDVSTSPLLHISMMLTFITCLLAKATQYRANDE
ncbi:MAG: ComEC/Rec2 family competence protein [Pseudomonadota bacterium]|nr:ComEC/Rec2 family competence protein [Pseudomonadota bacterium]